MLEAAAADEEHARSQRVAPRQDLLEPRVDRLAADRRNRRARRGREPSAQLVIVEHAAHRAAASAGASLGGTSSPFTSSCTTSGTPPTAVATTGVPTDERLDRGVRQVLPGARSTAAAAPAR